VGGSRDTLGSVAGTTDGALPSDSLTITVPLCKSGPETNTVRPARCHMPAREADSAAGGAVAVTEEKPPTPTAAGLGTGLSARTTLGLGDPPQPLAAAE
jgi:hypothetical protein